MQMYVVLAKRCSKDEAIRILALKKNKIEQHMNQMKNRLHADKENAQQGNTNSIRLSKTKNKEGLQKYEQKEITYAHVQYHKTLRKREI